MPEGTMGIGHTVELHGRPSDRNSHPHTDASGSLLLHNGIIENYLVLKEI